ncbi:helicase associated domain-containing protein [Streptomyces sp. NBC_01369]|uniref:helicase associated domain-containing protein n=1 Tax=Streptomyces sp. NBC_01369 TaxID=2903842 RepID=UPI00386A081A
MGRRPGCCGSARTATPQSWSSSSGCGSSTRKAPTGGAGSRRPDGGCARPESPCFGCRTRSSRQGLGRGRGYPLGQWIADQRRAYTAGTLEAGRVAELEKLGMVWSEQEAA